MRLTKSRDDIVLSGVLAGLGEYFNIDPTLLRIGFVILVFVGVGIVIPLYIVGAIIIPRAPKEKEKERRRFDRRNPRKPRNPRDRRNRRNFDRPERPDFKQANHKEDVTTKANEIDEDDWSDF